MLTQEQTFFLWTGSLVGLAQELKVVKFWRNPKDKALGTSVKVGLNTSMNKIILCECCSWNKNSEGIDSSLETEKLKNWDSQALLDAWFSISVLGEKLMIPFIAPLYSR